MTEKIPRILTIKSHYDDNAWTIGGTIAKKTISSSVVDTILLTDSNAQGIGPQRYLEELESSRILGIDKTIAVGSIHHFKDGHLLDRPLEDFIVPILHFIDVASSERFPYTDIYTFGEDGYSGHPDHVVTAKAVLEIFKLRPDIQNLWQVGMSPEERKLWLRDYKNHYFVPIPEIDTGNFYRSDISGTIDLKVEAIKAHSSQRSNGGDMHAKRIMELEPVELFNKIERI